MKYLKFTFLLILSFNAFSFNNENVISNKKIAGFVAVPTLAIILYKKPQMLKNSFKLISKIACFCAIALPSTAIQALIGETEDITPFIENVINTFELNKKQTWKIWE